MFALIRRHKDFVGNVATLATGKTIAIAVSFLLTPVVARLFKPEHFGVAALFVSVITIGSTVATLRYDRGPVLPESDRTAGLLMTLAMLAVTVSALLFWGLLAGFSALHMSMPFMGGLGVWVWVVPLGLVFIALENVIENWLVRMTAYRAIAHSDIQQNLWTAAGRLGGGFAFGSSIWALIWGYMLGKLVRIGIMVFGAPGWPVQKGLLDARALREAAVEYRDFPMFNMPTNFIRSFSTNIPVLFLGAWFDPAIVGFYAMANRLVRIPADLMANTVRRVFLQKAAEIHNDGRALRGAFRKVTVGLAALGAGPMLVLYLFGEPIFALVLGENWGTAGLYASILAPWLFVVLTSVPALAVLVILRRQALWLRVELIMAALRVGAFMLAYDIYATPTAAIQAFSLISATANFSLMVMVYYLIPKRAHRFTSTTTDVVSRKVQATKESGHPDDE